MALRSLAIGLVVCGVLTSAGRARADDPPFIQVGVDVAYGESSVQFVGPGDVMPALCAAITCVDGQLDLPTMRATASVGHGTFAFEASFTVPYDAALAQTYMTWSAGVRFDTSFDGWLAMFFRFAYVKRLGEVSGEGGRAGIGLMVRPVWWLAGYVEASADITSIPSSMNDAGLLFSYATFVGGGLRLGFGP